MIYDRLCIPPAVTHVTNIECKGARFSRLTFVSTTLKKLDISWLMLPFTLSSEY